jgi:hypothetical protein
MLHFNPWQRIQLSLLVGGVKGAAAEIRKAVKLLDILEMNDAEKAEIGLRIDGAMMVWEKKDYDFEVEIKDANLLSYLKTLVAQKSDWPVNKDAVGLFDQLGID